MREREYKLTLTEEEKNKIEQFLHLLGVDADIVEAENIKESEEKSLKLGQIYYAICSDGTIFDCSFDPDSSYCKARLALGNCFKTREEAEFESERLKVIAEMKKFAESEDRKWSNGSEHWYPYYDFSYNSIRYFKTSLCKSHNVYFKSKERRKNA